MVWARSLNIIALAGSGHRRPPAHTAGRQLAPPRCRPACLHLPLTYRPRKRQGRRINVTRGKVIGCFVSKVAHWIPFGDHPLKMQRYSEN